MVTLLDSRLSDLSAITGQRHHVVFLDKTLHSHIPSFHPGRIIQSPIKLTHE